MEYIEKYLQRGDNMKNVFNIIKYSLENYKLLYIIEMCILAVAIFIGIFNGGALENIISSISVVSLSMVVIITNTVAEIVLFNKQISREQGLLFFSTPIKGTEFIMAKVIEVVGVYAVVFLLNVIVFVIKYGLGELFIQHSFEVIYSAFSYIVWVIVLMFLMAIIWTYIKNSTLRVVTLVLLETVGMIIYEVVISFITYIIPYINIVTNGGIRYNIVEIIINSIVIIALGIFAAKRIDENLNIC